MKEGVKMEKGRSEYSFNFTCDRNSLEQLIKGYLQANQFTEESNNNETYYKAGDKWIKGLRFFKYNINENTVTITAWLANSFTGKDMPAEPNIEYKNSLNSLFQEIAKLESNGGIIMNKETNQNINNNNEIQNNSTNVNEFANNFENEIKKKKEKLCNIGFWLSILGLLCSFMGISYGVFIYALNFYFASQGLKTKKKGKAKATIVISIISIIISILWLFA